VSPASSVTRAGIRVPADAAAAVPATDVPTAPPLPADLEVLLRRLRLPHIRRHAPDVVATAKAQRWEPVEVLRALLAEEAAGRDRSALATRRAAAGASGTFQQQAGFTNGVAEFVKGLAAPPATYCRGPASPPNWPRLRRSRSGTDVHGGFDDGAHLVLAPAGLAGAAQ
jgi:hypothetical protein